MSKKKDKKKKPSKPVKKAAKKPAKPAKKAAKKPAPKKSAKPAKKAKPAPKKSVKKPAKKAKVTKSKPRPSGRGKVAVKKAAKKVAPKKVIKKAAKPTKNQPSVLARGKAVAIKKPATKSVAIKTKPVKVEKNKSSLAGKPLKVEKAAKPIVTKEKPARRGKGGRKPKNKDGDDEPEIVHDELIEQIIQSTRRQAKQPKQPKIIKTFVNPHESLALAVPEETKKAPKKEPKGKFELEYVVRTSAGILFELLTTPSGLSEWFSDDVNIRDGIFTFFWDGSEQKAKLLAYKEEKLLRLAWMDKPEGYYFEFRIERDELTGDVSLIITDFADEASDQETSKRLWDSQVNKLLNVLGSN
jgi:uncharacterized protein YndB with AHSA1/START domain